MPASISQRAKRPPVDLHVDGRREKVAERRGWQPGGADTGVSEIADNADLYMNFHDGQEWLAAHFRGMTPVEFEDFVAYCLAAFERAAETRDHTELQRVKGLMLALARKDLEIAHFTVGLSAARRSALITAACAQYELARSLFPADEQRAIEQVWNATRDHALRFGYLSMLFEMLPPYRLFREPGTRREISPFRYNPSALSR